MVFFLIIYNSWFEKNNKLDMNYMNQFFFKNTWINFFYIIYSHNIVENQIDKTKICQLTQLRNS